MNEFHSKPNDAQGRDRPLDNQRNSLDGSIDDDGESPLAKLVREVRKSAFAGAASVIPSSRLDLIDEIVDWTLHEIACRIGDIKNLRSYAYSIARRQAQRWLGSEEKLESLDREPTGGDQFDQGEIRDIVIAGIVEPGIVFRDELIDSLPELFARFQGKVIEQLPPDDREFFQRYFIENLPPAELAKSLGIQERSLAQRWRRLLLSLHKGLLAELEDWAQGRELYYDVLRDRSRIVEFLCLIRLFLQEGFEAVKDIIDSISSR